MNPTEKDEHEREEGSAPEPQERQEAPAQPLSERPPEAVEGAEAPAQAGGLRDEVIEALRGVYDPEIPVNIYDLGLIYGLSLEEDGKVFVQMTLTAPGCPVADEMPGMVQEAVGEVEGVKAVDVELVWDPPWDPSKMSEAARLELGML